VNEMTSRALFDKIRRMMKSVEAFLWSDAENLRSVIFNNESGRRASVSTRHSNAATAVASASSRFKKSAAKISGVIAVQNVDYIIPRDGTPPENRSTGMRLSKSAGLVA